MQTDKELDADTDAAVEVLAKVLEPTYMLTDEAWATIWGQLRTVLAAPAFRTEK